MIKTHKFNISIHPLFILLLVYSILVRNILFFVLYTFSVVLHEMGHSVVARKRGYKMNKLVLLPYGAMISGETDEFTPKDEFIIAIAGPITNFILSTICVALWWIFPESYTFTFDLCIASMVAGVFNFLPVFPLDGGRVMLGFLSTKLSREMAVKIVKLITFVFSILLFLLFILTIFTGFNISIGITSILLFASGITSTKEIKYERINRLFDRERQIKRGIEERNIVVDSESTLKTLFSKIERGKLTTFIISKNGVKIKEIDEFKLRELFKVYPYKTKIMDII